jgi:hypothetical protein
VAHVPSGAIFTTLPDGSDVNFAIEDQPGCCVHDIPIE